MELIGDISEKQIYYANIQNERDWFTKLPPENWIAFSTGDYVDVSFMNEVVSKCLENNVGYVCSAGNFEILLKIYLMYT